MGSDQLGAVALCPSAPRIALGAPCIALTIRNIPNAIHGQRHVHAVVQKTFVESTSFSICRTLTLCPVCLTSFFPRHQ